MITYDKIKNKEKLVISLTGLTPSEFGMLLPFSEEAEDILISRKIGETERERVCGGGRKSALGTISDKLLSVLFYSESYPLQILPGFLSEWDRARQMSGFADLRKYPGLLFP